MKILGVIPARYASTRFPGKPLVMIAGQTMIERVYRQAKLAHTLSKVLVATDDQRIYDHVVGFGGEAIMTSTGHPSGTDRILEVVARLGGYDAYLNIQGDEPFIAPEQIDLVGGLLGSKKGAFVATLMKRMQDLAELHNPNTIKVVTRRDGQALFFSRSMVPFMRKQGGEAEWHEAHGFFKHIGIYGYSAEAMEAIRNMDLGALEQAESLEQLRWMENGIPIFVAETTQEGHSVDVPEDLDKLPIR